MTDYAKKTLADLQAELKKRGLDYRGLKRELVARLERNDAGEDSSDEEEVEVKELPKKRTRTPVKSKKEVDEDSDEEEEEEEEEDSGKGSKRIRDKKAQKEEKEKEEGGWEKHGSVLYLSSGQKPTAVIAAFDMDDCLIKTKSGKVFPRGRTDWQWLFDSVPERLKQLNKEGATVVIFTNQAGIGKKGKWDEGKASQIKGKIVDLAKDLGFGVTALVATDDDEYRKPSAALWRLMLSLTGAKPDMSKSFFVGDAGGRPVDWKEGRKKDFSCSDRKFAHNVGLTYHTPEEFFENEEVYTEFSWLGLDPAKLKEGGKLCDGGIESLTSGKQEIILFSGRPASGKSTFAKKYLVPKGYVHVNRDTLSTIPKCIKAMKEALSEGKSVVIDNTNPDESSRRKFIDVAEEAEVPIRCFWFQTPDEVADHLNYYRERMTKGEVPHVPSVAINMYNKKATDPDTEEGFTEVKKINFVLNFADADERKEFMQFA